MKFAKANGAEGLPWQAWGQLDPDKALAAVTSHGDRFALVSVLRGIANRVPDAVRRLSEKFPAAFHDRQVQETLARALEAGDPKGAAELAYRCGSKELGGLVRRWAAADENAALAGRLSMADQGARTGLLQAIFDGWAESAPEKIAPAIDRLPTGQPRTTLMIAEALRRWRATRRRPWPTRGRPRAPRLVLLAAVLQRLAPSDPDRTMAALAEIGKGEEADRGPSPRL